MGITEEPDGLITVLLEEEHLIMAPIVAITEPTIQILHGAEIHRTLRIELVPELPDHQAQEALRAVIAQEVEDLVNKKSLT